MHIGINITISSNCTGGGGGGFSPLDSDDLVAWWDASDASSLTVTGGNVEEWRDQKAGLALGQTTAGRRPAYETSNAAANGNPAVVWPDTALNNKVLLTAAEYSAAYLVIVCAYRSGAETTFAGSTDLIGRTTGGADNNRVIGSSGTADLLVSPETYNTVGASVNGGAVSLTVLPLPLSVVELEAQRATAKVRYLGNFSTATRGWQGPITDVLSFSAVPSAEYLADLRAYFNTNRGT